MTGARLEAQPSDRHEDPFQAARGGYLLGLVVGLVIALSVGVINLGLATNAKLVQQRDRN
ncbi:MAG: hypothetical protein M3Y62_02605 [Candidatus Dormibacteraeota bacterium]|nr:hypothetical protein [Candidatus Dormibacteraeota bacterium]